MRRPLLYIDLESIAVELPLHRPSLPTICLFVGALVAFEGVCVGIFADGAPLCDEEDVESTAGEGGSSGG